MLIDCLSNNWEKKEANIKVSAWYRDTVKDMKIDLFKILLNPICNQNMLQFGYDYFEKISITDYEAVM